MCENSMAWRENTIQATGIVFSLVFVFLYFICLCLVEIAKKRRLAVKSPVYYSDNDDVEILRKTSEMPDLQPPPSYDVLQDPPPPSYNSLASSRKIGVK